jgi:Arm DNA-binding domain/Phage integrase, N-terminal SAM-like domain
VSGVIFKLLTEKAKLMSKGRTSKRSVDALTCENGKDRNLLWDDSIAGFGVAAFPSGRKVYLAQYRQGGRSRRVHIGEHGRLTPDEARSEAKKLLGAVESGADPIARRQASRAVPLFRQMADEFMHTHVGAKRKARTLDSYETLLRRHVLPAIGGLKVTDIRRAHVSKMHADLAAHPGAANRALSVVSAIWNWAAIEHEDLALPPNPAKGIKRNPEEGRERFLSSDELARLGDALVEAETVGLPFTVDEAKTEGKTRAEARELASQARPLRDCSGPALDPVRGSPTRNLDRKVGVCRLRAWAPKFANLENWQVVDIPIGQRP